METNNKKYCNKCGNPLAENSNYCSSCGIAQNVEEVIVNENTKNLPGIITTLGVITLLGSSFGILRGLFYQAASDMFGKAVHEEENYFRGYILVFLNIGTLIAAILMFKLKRVGYYLYLLFQLSYILFAYYITTFYTSPEKITDGIPLSLLISAFFWMPSVILLILYLTLARKYFFNKRK